MLTRSKRRSRGSNDITTGEVSGHKKPCPNVEESPLCIAPKSTDTPNRRSTRNKSCPLDTPEALIINSLNDDILLHIFSYFDSLTKVRVINRVCWRWRNLIMDKLLWKKVDFRYIPIKRRGGKYIIKNFCSNVTKEISLKAKSMKGDHPKYKMKSRRHGFQWDGARTRSMTWDLWDHLKKECVNLRKFSISYELLIDTWRDFLAILPEQLTHLSVPYCILNMNSMHPLMDSNQFPTRFKCLKYLDVSGIRYDEYVSCGLLPLGTFPPTLETLRMSNCLDFIGHHNHGPGDIARNLATAYKQLTILDISINDMEKCLLVELSKGLDQLQYLNVCGCVLLSERNPVTIAWNEIWTEGFLKLRKVHLRNIREKLSIFETVSFEPMAEMLRDRGVVDIIDVNGQVYGRWSKADKQEEPIETN